MRSKQRPMGRRDFVQFVSVLSGGGTVFGNAILTLAEEGARVTREMVCQAEAITGMKFSDAQRDILVPTLQDYLLNLQRIREICLEPEIAPSLCFLSETQSIWMLNRGKSREG
jgi:hypothetical protein